MVDKCRLTYPDSKDVDRFLGCIQGDKPAELSDYHSSKPALNLECIVESGVSLSSFDVKINFDTKKVTGLFGVRGSSQESHWMELDLFKETDNSYEIRQKPEDSGGIIFNWPIQMRWVLNRSTGKLMGEEWNNRYGWESSVEDYSGYNVTANCSKVNSEKLF